ncbi:F-box and associated interaction domains-containing protein [Euphorbia peplus]|nr:F-box and associated interaction domains-containing protein [Euphorbia peplus]
MKQAVVMELPDEIWIDILSRVPAKSLLIAKAVCKSWYSFINNKQFIKHHLNRAHSTHYNQHKNVLGVFFPDSNYGSKHCFLIQENSDGTMNAKECEPPFKVVKVCNFCDGLICFIMYSRGKFDILIWNPCFPSVYKRIPVEDKTKRWSDTFLVGMGYNPTTDDYKIVMVPHRPARSFGSFVDVFSLKSSSWHKKEISKTSHYSINGSPMYIRNRLHWIGRLRRGNLTESIIYFDVVEERFGYVNLPSNAYFTMFDYKDSLAIMDANGIHVLVDYNGKESSWKKVFKRPELLSLELNTRSYKDGCFTRDGKILIYLEREGASTYDPESGIVKKIMIRGDDNFNPESSWRWFYYASPYIESLLSLR